MKEERGEEVPSSDCTVLYCTVLYCVMCVCAARDTYEKYIVDWSQYVHTSGKQLGCITV